MSTKTQSVIELVRIKSWYIPANAEAYLSLKAASVPLLIFHKDFLPTLQLAARKHGLRAQETTWTELFASHMDKVGAQWKSQVDRSCKITDTKLIFTAKATARNRKAVAALEASLCKFFARWAFRYRPTFSETFDRYKLVVEFKFDPELPPVVPVMPAEVKREHELVLGFTKLKLTFFDKPTDELRARGMIAPLVMTEIFTQAGTEWVPVFTSTCKPSQIGDVRGFMAGYAELFNRMQINDR